MELLLHVCCAICASKAMGGIRREWGPEAKPSLFWWNGNIHPLIEYRRRLKSAKMFAERLGLEFSGDERYGLTAFCRAVHGKEALGERCRICYAMRLEATAAEAARRGIGRFSTTLLASPHQDHAALRDAGEAAGKRHGVEFVYRDWRGDEGEPDWTAMLYRQSYCGCVFSEYDRYCRTTTHLYPPGTKPPELEESGARESR